jgi:hypothetical protein
MGIEIALVTLKLLAETVDGLGGTHHFKRAFKCQYFLM